MRVVLFAMLLVLAACTAESPDPTGSSGDLSNVTIENLQVPWDMEFVGGELLITERAGRVLAHMNGSVRTIGEINVSAQSEAGLLGIAVHPQYPREPYVYVLYTSDEDNRIARFTYANGSLSEETVLLDGIPRAQWHDGGALDFGPDGLLYATTGDATTPSSAQDLDSRAGKILRLEPDGSVPDDNPFENYVYSYGHRNPQGLAWDENGTLYAAEHGPSSHDEVNRIEAGGNYGWPEQCGSQRDDTIEPLRCFDEFTIAPSGLEYHDGTLYVAGLRGAQVRALTLQNGSIGEEEVIVDGIGRIRSLLVHNDTLLYGTSNSESGGSDDVIRSRALA